MEHILNEIKNCLEHDCFIGAFVLALTVPDACGKAEYPELKVGERYKKWYDENIGYSEIPPTRPDDKEKGYPEFPYLSGEVVYSLRNQMLHQATPDVEVDKIKEERNQTTEFKIIIEPENEYGLYGGHMVVSMQGIGDKTRIHHVSLRDFCIKMYRVGTNYYSENREKFAFITAVIEDHRNDQRRY